MTTEAFKRATTDVEAGMPVQLAQVRMKLPMVDCTADALLSSCSRRARSAAAAAAESPPAALM